MWRNLRVIFQSPLHKFDHRNLETLCSWVVWAPRVLPALWSPDAPMWELALGWCRSHPTLFSLSLAAGGKEFQGPQVVWSVCWPLETWQVHSLRFGGSLCWSIAGHPWQRWTPIPGRSSASGSARRCLNTTLKKKYRDAHQRLCFCFVAIAVTATLCESKLWLWPEMTPVGDGCRKKEAVSVELASARSRTPRAMEEVDF